MQDDFFPVVTCMQRQQDLMHHPPDELLVHATVLPLVLQRPGNVTDLNSGRRLVCGGIYTPPAKSSASPSIWISFFISAAMAPLVLQMRESEHLRAQSQKCINH